MENQRNDDESRFDREESGNFGFLSGVVEGKSEESDTKRDMNSSPLPSSESFEIPLTATEKKRRQIFNRAKAIPVTKTQKRARWIPGHRYMPILLVQRIWHPISSMLYERRPGSSSGHVNDNKLHHGDHHHHYHHHHHDHLQIGPSASFVSQIYPSSRSGFGSNDIFME